MSVCHVCTYTLCGMCTYVCFMHVHIHVYMLHAYVYACVYTCIYAAYKCVCMCCCMHMYVVCVHACMLYEGVCMCVYMFMLYACGLNACVYMCVVYACMFGVWVCVCVVCIVSLYVCVLYAHVWCVYVCAYRYEDYKLMWESSSIMLQLIFGTTVCQWIWRSPVQWINWPGTSCDPCASTTLPNTGAMDTPHTTAYSQGSKLGFPCLQSKCFTHWIASPAPNWKWLATICSFCPGVFLSTTSPNTPTDS